MRTKIPTLQRRQRSESRVDAFVTLRAYGTRRSHQYYCGPWGTPRARRVYHELIEKWEAADRRILPDDLPPREAHAPTDNSVSVLAAAYLASIKTTKRRVEVMPRIRAVVDLAGELDVAEFGPNLLRAVRREIVERNIHRLPTSQPRETISRKTANDYARGIISMFKWGVAREFVKPATLHALQTLEPLKPGDTSAIERVRVRPVADAHIEATAHHAPPVIAAMIRLQRLTGMRSGELVLLRATDIDMSNPHAWAYRPTQHKTQHRGLSRVIYLGPRAQQLIKPLLTADAAAYLFQPAAAVAWRRAQRSATRKTPPTSGNAPGTNRVEVPQRPPGDRYTTASYRKAVAYALELAERAARAAAEKSGVTVAADSRLIPKWHPHQLRHALITELRARGVDKQTVAEFVGHHELKMTDHYTDGLRLARQLAEEAG